VTIVLTVVIFGVSLGDLLSEISRGRVPPGLLFTLLLLNLPQAMSTIIPISVFISIIWGLGRLYRDQEMAVMRASGFSWQMLLRPLFNLLLPVVVILLMLGLFFSPMAAHTAQEKLAQAFRNASEWGLQTGQFHVLRGGDMVLYVESVAKDGKRLNNIFIQQRQNRREQVWIAEEGYYWLDEENGERYLTLENGQITEGQPGLLDFGIIRFSRNDIRLPHPEERTTSTDVETRPSRQLLGSANQEEAAELQWRITPAIAIIVLGLLAIPLSHSSPREGRGGRVLLGILCYAIYANLLYMCRSWIAEGALPTILGMWWVHLFGLLVALVWLQQQGRMVGRG
jgi:lipopolysaccharide export system permease protein